MGISITTSRFSVVPILNLEKISDKISKGVHDCPLIEVCLVSTCNEDLVLLILSVARAE